VDPTETPIAPPRRRTAFVIVGGLLVAAALVGGIVATVVASWVNSVCADSAATVNAHRQSLRLEALAAWLMVITVPVLIALAARRRHRRIWPWTTVAGVFLLIALSMTLSIQPSRFCLY